MKGPSISLQNVSLNLAGNCILEPVNAELQAGQLHLLIGPNGAGKTSLLKTLLGLMPHKGEVLRHWPAGTDKNTSDRLPVYIPQQPKFDAVLPVTVMDYLAASISRRPLFFRQSGRIKTQVMETLEVVAMADKAELQLGKLSGGERQRLMFAQALQQKAGLWFMDEPMTGLDGEGQRIITGLIQRLRQEQKTLVMVHHDMDFVRQYADNVLLVDGGVKQTGTPEQVLGRSDTAMLEVA
ncbi:metal ABC transporter ATP-binding protein [Spongorhabdus nitratireducens]